MSWIYDKAVDAVAEEASRPQILNAKKVKLAAKQPPKASNKQSPQAPASEVLGLDQEQRDPEAIDYEATHPPSSARNSQTVEPSCEIEINSVHSTERGRTSP